MPIDHPDSLEVALEVDEIYTALADIVRNMRQRESHANGLSSRRIIAYQKVLDDLAEQGTSAHKALASNVSAVPSPR